MGKKKGGDRLDQYPLELEGTSTEPLQRASDAENEGGFGQHLRQS